MKSHKLFTLALAGSLAVATGCKKDLLEQTNPNTLSVAQYWLSADDANKGEQLLHGRRRLVVACPLAR